MEPSDLNQLFTKDVPLLDVRAPIEFERGAFPTSVNMPILDNQQREHVGRCYKQQGRDDALSLGHRLVNGEIRTQRVQSWTVFLQQHPSTQLYCFRGGLRSQIAQQWLQQNGVDVPIIQGGYKALRQHLINALETLPGQFNFALIGGLTGNGKTSLIRSLPAAIDLEGAAHHRGSSFGAHATPQHTQINFENKLAVALLKQANARHPLLVLEDEGRCIGSVDIPQKLFVKMRLAPLVIIEDPLERRIERLIDEYIIQMQAEFCALHGAERSLSLLTEYLLGALGRIRKRLGNTHYQVAYSLMTKALNIHQQCNHTDAHADWLHYLLTHYYDPMYKSQLKQKSQQVLFRGTYGECHQYVTTSLLTAE